MVFYFLFLVRSELLLTVGQGGAGRGGYGAELEGEGGHLWTLVDIYGLAGRFPPPFSFSSFFSLIIYTLVACLLMLRCVQVGGGILVVA